jgi:pimeloyl-ACP methyl ester carboxylesterase
MFLKTSDAELLVTSYGDSPRTIVAHGGWVGSGELWAAPFERLSQSWRTVTYDHRGTGATRHSAPAITFDLLVGDLFRVLDALNIDTCVLAAESMGAMVALEAALRHPERFTGLVIVGGRYSGARTPARDRLVAGCKADFRATMEAFRQCLHARGRLRGRARVGQADRESIQCGGCGPDDGMRRRG